MSITHFRAVDVLCLLRCYCGTGAKSEGPRAISECRVQVLALGRCRRWHHSSCLQLRPDPQAFSSTFLITSTISGHLVILNTSIWPQKASGLCFLRGNNFVCTRLSLVTNTRTSQGISALLWVWVPHTEQMLCSLWGSEHIFEASPKKWNNEMIIHLICFFYFLLMLCTMLLFFFFFICSNMMAWWLEGLFYHSP